MLPTRRAAARGTKRSGVDLTIGSPTRRLDLLDLGDRFVVLVEVPGYERNDIEITLSGSTLAIAGERERDPEAGDVLRRERRANAFSRRLPLPEPVDADAAEASVQRGVVRITLPKRAGRSGRYRIDVE